MGRSPTVTMCNIIYLWNPTTSKSADPPDDAQMYDVPGTAPADPPGHDHNGSEPDHDMAQTPDDDMPEPPPDDVPSQGNIPVAGVPPSSYPDMFDISSESGEPSREFADPDEPMTSPKRRLPEHEMQPSPRPARVAKPKAGIDPSKGRRISGSFDDDAPADPHASSSSGPHHSGEASPPVLPIAEPDAYHDSPGEAEASDAETLEYSEDEDLYVDQADWSSLTGSLKAHSACASFTVPQVDGIDVSSDPQAQQQIMHHAMSVSAKTRAKTAARANGRKEATAADVRMFRKQFAEAKQAECKSWKANEVYTLVDLRKVK